MKGHEYPRQLLKAMLETQVPLRLAVIRAQATTDPEVPETWPPDPRAYLLADLLPMKEEQFPAVLITSTTAESGTTLQSGLGEYVFEYSITVGVAVISPRHDSGLQSSIGRDRILLAVREALLLNSSLASDCEVFARKPNEQTGAAMENLQGKPMSLGNITFTVRVTETLTDPVLDLAGDPAVISTTAETVLAVDATKPLP